ncbi:Membrane dipeptidase (Peptidase family M19) [Lentzea waywayandensis]|uniref:Membrane dipeptidase (Peptidase family M19) n=1 Tax=Lentzea waywayandensis TaxID=84724 RepID=A0A1I6EWY3_9PSEU|nr:membrane dipeptidase [Lentzea waywayandensis]SFR22151.1 Membrane dipeptidase (Peptidase family M19) [Lentzea waywayandensis]
MSTPNSFTGDENSIDTGLFGLADTHVHFRADLGFGGRGVFGPPVPPSSAGLASALPHCTAAHGPWGLLPSLDGVGHRVGGFPQFDGWPTHRTQAHQQAYVDWIKRAVDGGLRLVVCLAVNNELVARRFRLPFTKRTATDDMSAIDRQLTGIREMVRYVDDQCGGRGWLEIADDPAHARRIVAAGRLAVVRGVEMDTLGNWPTPEALERQAAAQGVKPEELVAALVHNLYSKGVRHVFAVHATNNAFGAPAIFARTYDAANYLLTGDSFVVESAPQDLGIAYRLDEDTFDGGGLAERFAYHGWRALWHRAGPPRPTNWAQTPGGHINAGGLTEHGRTLVKELMRRGMMLDGDHMSHKTLNEVLDLCEAQQYPVVSGHSSPRELRHGWRPSLPDPAATFSRTGNAAQFGTANTRMLSTENNRSPEQLQRILRLGGMVSIFCYQRDVRTAAGAAVTNDCAGSSRSFAQALHYVHDAMRGRIAIGTDVNGVGQLPGPRFGPNGAAGLRNRVDQIVRRTLRRPLRRDEVLVQKDGVRYATPLLDYRAPRFAPGDGPPLTPIEQEFWAALAIWQAGVTPESADQPPWWSRFPTAQNRVINLSYGLRATAREQLPLPIRFRRIRQPWPWYRGSRAIQLAAFLARHGEPPRPDDPAPTRRLTPLLAPVWRHWTAMTGEQGTSVVPQWQLRRFGATGSGLYTDDGAIARSVAGRRDFDINVDGMAHYGLLPDFLQDLRNIGAPPTEVDALYSSAEKYIQVWERCLEQAP